MKVLRYLDPRADLTFSGVPSCRTGAQHTSEKEHNRRCALQGHTWTTVPRGDANVLDRYVYATRTFQRL